MPMYEYECPRCGTFEVQQRMSDPPLATHAECGSAVERHISATSFSLKGSGWHADGYSKRPGKTADAPSCAPGGCERLGCAAKAGDAR
ncbi:MAG: zinc ribbon domain-containing protein [Deltaproteobacteria bacterium]|nr:zinc ribbon domain-containing protein [Deltaproteobacteria bacterium]